MTWEWVVLILGLVLINAGLLGFVAWTNMNAKIVEMYPKTLPELMMVRRSEEDASSED